ncbi:uncharacterized protein V1516DRAFT_672874 [Lipomyces oligophaga]|uniref:uncharacterized protein n=1 Tax=Lipomyces oligophaga TaxID=45792 RepID=UPI0034CE2774
MAARYKLGSQLSRISQRIGGLGINCQFTRLRAISGTNACFYSSKELEYKPLPPRILDIRNQAKAGLIKEGDDITIHGWIRSIRKQRKIAFAHVVDGSSDQMFQLTFLNADDASGLANGMSVKATGKLELVSHIDPYALRVSSVTILGGYSADTTGTVATFPLQKKAMALDYIRRELPALRFRTSQIGSAMRLRSKSIASISRFFDRDGYTQTQPPLITASDCEGAGEVFTVVAEGVAHGEPSKFFGSKTYLTVSTQLHLEALMMGLTRVWTLTPAFRAEESATSRHLSEFWMLEAEVAFADDLENIMSIVERMIRACVSELKQAGDFDSLVDLKRQLDKQQRSDSDRLEDEEVITAEGLVERWDMLIGESRPWMRITYSDAIVVLEQAVSAGQATFQHPVEPDEGLKTEHEKWLAKHYARGPVFVTHYPTHMKPFYMLQTVGSDTVECFDLLVPDLGELVGGSLRQHDYDGLQRAIVSAGLDDPAALDWYLELRRWGTVPHGGFGMGFERFICYIGGIQNIREAIAFPRWIDHCKC